MSSANTSVTLFLSLFLGTDQLHAPHLDVDLNLWGCKGISLQNMTGKFSSRTLSGNTFRPLVFTLLDGTQHNAPQASRQEKSVLFGGWSPLAQPPLAQFTGAPAYFLALLEDSPDEGFLLLESSGFVRWFNLCWKLLSLELQILKVEEIGMYTYTSGMPYEIETRYHKYKGIEVLQDNKINMTVRDKQAVQSGFHCEVEVHWI
ncbi:hypothetical protein C8J56DRAFT_902473 [Mycena floridula]|nr:hypothetical protein C8J56DRAFT_902473 [Mycena floridula]